MDKRRILKRIIAISLIAIPFVLGFIGFADLYEDIGSRLYHTMALYAFSFDAEEEYLQGYEMGSLAPEGAGVIQVAQQIAGERIREE